jgi:2-methylcitrate dehydratase PrpD
MNRVRLEVDEVFEAQHPAKWGAGIEIATRSDQSYSAKTDFPRGDPENPVDEDTLISKFRMLARDSWGEERVEALSQVVMNLEKVEDIALLFSK